MFRRVDDRRTSMGRRRGSARTLSAIAGAIFVGMLVGHPTAAEAQDQITVQLDFNYLRGNYAPFFLARDKGMFEDEGIEVTEIRMGRGSADTAQRIAQGTSEFGFADLPTTLVVRSRGAPVVALAATNVLSPLAMVSLADRVPLNEPKDLEGQSIAVTPALSTYYFFHAFAAINGVDLSKVTEVAAAPPYEPLLLSGRVTALPGYIDAEIPILAEHAGGMDELDILLGHEYGYDAFGTGVITSDKIVEERPDLVERFMRAYLRAFRYTIDHPDEAVQVLMAVDPKLKPEILRAQLEADIEHTFTDETTEKCGLGYMAPQRWEATRDILVTQEVIEEVSKLEDVYTNRFIGDRC